MPMENTKPKWYKITGEDTFAINGPNLRDILQEMVDLIDSDKLPFIHTGTYRYETFDGCHEFTFIGDSGLKVDDAD